MSISQLTAQLAGLLGGQQQAAQVQPPPAASVTAGLIFRPVANRVLCSYTAECAFIERMAPAHTRAWLPEKGAYLGLAWPGLACLGLTWPDLAWLGLAWPDLT